MEKSELMTDSESSLQSISFYMLRDGLDLVADFRKSRGSHLYDTKRGDYFLDLFSCFATVPLGYNHPRMTTPEALEELGWCAVQKPSNSDVYSLEMAQFVETLGKIATPNFIKHMFFISGGTLAVENALKTAFDWKVRKNLAAGKGVLGYKVIHFELAFHGRSGYTLSLTNTDPKKTKYFPKFDWPRITSPRCTFPLEGENLKKVVLDEEKAISQIRAVLDKEHDEIACLIIEPIQGEGGDNYFRREFHQELRNICDEYEILFIYDEVQTGFGSTGKMWACEHYVRPDIIAFGKKAQVCGILAGDRIDDVDENVFSVSSRINSTWGGNLIDMVRCRMHLEIYEEERILDHVTTTGKVLLEELLQLQLDFPDKVSNARGLGFFGAFDLPTPEFRDRLVQELFANRVIILGCGTRSIRFRPSLNTPEEDLKLGVRIIRKVLRQME